MADPKPEPESESESQPEPKYPGPIAKIIKGLASTNPKIRSKSLVTLSSWLPTQTLISNDVMKKLWKSLFYSMWHCDKIENQMNLIDKLANLFLVLPKSVSVSYFSNFVVTIRREWNGIDHLRLDKFYLLIRVFIRNLFVLMKNMKWDLAEIECFVEVLEKDLFFIENEELGFGYGVCYHVVSVFCEELLGFLPLGLGVLKVLFRPFVVVMGRSGNKVLVGKVKGCVFDYLVKNGKDLLELKKCGSEVDEKDERVLFGSIVFSMGFASLFYELGSSPSCLQGNRKVVFGLHDEFSKLEKECSSLGFEFPLPEVVDSKDENVSQLMDVDVKRNGDNDDAKKKMSKDKKSKKKKKKKNQGGSSEVHANGDLEMVNSNEGNTNVNEQEENADEFVLTEDAVSNLQKQFEKIAAESGLEGDVVSALESPPSNKANGKPLKKRKRSKGEGAADAETSVREAVVVEQDAPMTEEKSNVKRVKFSMKNNLVWKPHSPLPPQSLRIPPSSTPRGSALKKGVSPGPIRETSSEKKKKKKKVSPLQKARKANAKAKHMKKVKVIPA